MMSERQDIQALIDTTEELVRALLEQVAQKEDQCQALSVQLADQMAQTADLRAQLVQHKNRNAVILFPKTPAT